MKRFVKCFFVFIDIFIILEYDLYNKLYFIIVALSTAAKRFRHMTERAKTPHKASSPSLSYYLCSQIIPKCFNASVMAASFSGGHFGCLEFSDFGLL